MSTYANLHPKYIFGLSAACKSNNVWWVDNTTIIYPAGNAVVMLNLDQKTQTFLHGVEKQKGVSCMTVSYNRVYAALGQVGDQPSIAIFDLKTNKRRKTLQSNDTKAKEYVSLNFTTDNVHLVSLTGGPDYTCVLWKWDRNRIVAMVKATGGLGPVYEVSTSPMDINVMCAVGNATFRFYRFNENHLKPYGFQRGDAHHFLCHAWYKNDKVVAGTSEGKLMLFERGDYRHDIQFKNVKNEITGGLAERTRIKTAEQKEMEENSVQGLDTLGQSPGPKRKGDPNRPTSNYLGHEVTAIAPYSKGFAVAYGVGNVIIFEEQLQYTTPEEHYKQMFVIRIPVDTSESEDRIIKTLSVGPNEEIIVASTFNCNIYMFQLSSVEIKEPEEMIFEFAHCSFHFGSVLSLDVAVRKSLLVTCGVDKFIRVWNFLSMSQEAQREFAEDIYCVSIHPAGLFLLAGMVDKIRMYTILINDIKETKDWPVRACKEIRFSNGGHLFAAANGNILQIYSTTTLENTHSIKGHSNRIKHICWTLDDNKIITAGSDGAIYEWDIQTVKRTSELVERGSKLVSVVVSPDAKTHYAINTKHLKEIQIDEGIILKEIDLRMSPTCISISRSGKILLAGFENGTIRSFRQPLTYSNEWTDYKMHYSAVNSLMCTCDEINCISVSADNSIVIWKMTDAEGRVAKMEKDLNYSTEVLVTKNELDERQAAINDLKQKFAELKIEMDYSLKRKEMTFQEEIRDLNSKFAVDITQLQEKIDELAKLKDTKADEYNQYLIEVRQYHQNSLENMEAHFNTKLISEFEKYNLLQNLLEETIKDYEGRFTNLETDRGKAIEELVEYFESKIKDKNSALEQAFNDAQIQMSESEEMKKQIEEDADQEILELTTSYERKLRHERETNAKLKGEAGIMRKKFQTIQKEIEERKNEVQKLHSECTKLSNAIKSTEREVVQLQKSLVDREADIVQKEKTIQELQKSTSDLEKFRFVLECRIKELRKIVEPKTREIIYLKQQNTDMESELDGTLAGRSGLQMQVSELQNKLKMSDSEYNNEKRMRVRLQVLLDRIRGHMVRCMSVLADHRALKIVVKSMYQKYGEGIQAGKASSAEQEAICELVRQKHHLEISLTSIKRKLAKDAQFTRTEQLKIMNENMLLVYEINNLRRELKISRDKIASYETGLGFHQSANAAEAAEMRFKLQHAIEDRDEIDIQHENVMEEKDALVEAQQEEIDSLSTKILKVHEFVHDTARPEGNINNTAVEHIRSVLTTNSFHV